MKKEEAEQRETETERKKRRQTEKIRQLDGNK